MPNKVNALGIGALSVSILSVALSIYAGYKLQSTFYYAMSIIWLIITYLVLRVYLSLRK